MVLHVENRLCLSARSAEMIDASHCNFCLDRNSLQTSNRSFFFLSIFSSDSLGFPKFFVEQN